MTMTEIVDMKRVKLEGVIDFGRASSLQVYIDGKRLDSRESLVIHGRFWRCPSCGSVHLSETRPECECPDKKKLYGVKID